MLGIVQQQLLLLIFSPEGRLFAARPFQGTDAEAFMVEA